MSTQSKLIRKTRTYTIKDYAECGDCIKRYLSKYPSYKFEGSSFIDNGDGTMNAEVRYFKNLTSTLKSCVNRPLDARQSLAYDDVACSTVGSANG